MEGELGGWAASYITPRPFFKTEAARATALVRFPVWDVVAQAGRWGPFFWWVRRSGGAPGGTGSECLGKSESFLFLGGWLRLSGFP
jgi:hypothetical protein